MSEECTFYYYDNGYCCALKREREGDASIDSDTVYRYCWGYHYDECPRYKNRDSSSGACFLTSACVEAKGLPDTCMELTVLRHFRDDYLRALPGGKKEIAEYYVLAPQIVNAIKGRADALSIFESIYQKLVCPCVDMIRCGKNEDAHKLYRETIQKLKIQFLAS